jgi:magnesium chelatase subunit I
METKGIDGGRKVMIQILPYSLLVGQAQLKLALELAYVALRLGGVLISGQRGTGKSTAVRAFSQMMYLDKEGLGRLPVTLPINATEDRVVGGWDLHKLVKGELEPQMGLLEEADGGLLYVDEVNLLDDHIVNIILDVTSTGVLVVQREGKSEQKPVSLTLVGTMNPEEGGLRPQLLDRFGLMVSVGAETDKDLRLKILQTVIDFDEALAQSPGDQPSDYVKEAIAKTQQYRTKLEKARASFYDVKVPRKAAESCVELAQKFNAEGNRGDYMIALAARACAALEGKEQVTNQHIQAVARLALQHRRPEVQQSNEIPWTDADERLIVSVLGGDA